MRATCPAHLILVVSTRSFKTVFTLLYQYIRSRPCVKLARHSASVFGSTYTSKETFSRTKQKTCVQESWTCTCMMAGLGGC
jgi:hypothetical protein